MGHSSGRPQESSRAAAAGPWKGHCDVPGSMPSDFALCLNPRGVVLSEFGIGSSWERALARVSFLSRDITRAEATPVS